MSRPFKFQDSTIIEPSLSESAKTDAGEILRRDRHPKLEVEIDATHSGVITNHRVYPAKFVSQGYRSFVSKENGGTADYNKPILRHHDMMDDPIGRIVSSKFTALKLGDQFEFDYLNPDTMGSKGSGIVTVKAVITDYESIKKIVDGRYLSVSAGHTSPIMLCSVCSESLMECSHLPGETYDSEDNVSGDGVLCYGITGPMTYHEVSFVNLPAQPVAKLMNYNWKDSKESWNKDLLTSFNKGKKEMVRAFSLIDEDGELSLLNGRHESKIKKTVIAVSPAVADKLKHVMSSEDHGVPDETLDVRQPNNGTISEVSGVGQNLDKAKNLDTQSKEENKMDDTKQLEEMEAKYRSLKDELTAAKTEVDALKKQIEAKDSQIQRLTTDATELQTRMSKSLAVSLASIRVRLKKPGTEGIDSKEALDQYVEKLSTRSAESLQDSLEDLIIEMPKTLVEDKNVELNSTKDSLSKDKLTSPTMSKGDKPKAKDNKREVRRGADALSQSLGLD